MLNSVGHIHLDIFEHPCALYVYTSVSCARVRVCVCMGGWVCAFARPTRSSGVAAWKQLTRRLRREFRSAVTVHGGIYIKVCIREIQRLSKSNARVFPRNSRKRAVEAAILIRIRQWEKSDAIANILMNFAISSNRFA